MSSRHGGLHRSILTHPNSGCVLRLCFSPRTVATEPSMSCTLLPPQPGDPLSVFPRYRAPAGPSRQIVYSFEVDSAGAKKPLPGARMSSAGARKILDFCRRVPSVGLAPDRAPYLPECMPSINDRGGRILQDVFWNEQLNGNSSTTSPSHEPGKLLPRRRSKRTPR